MSVIVLLVLWGKAPSAWAQGPGIQEAEVVVNGISHKGQRITLQVDRAVVERAWKTYLKNQAKKPVNGFSFWPFTKANSPKGIYTVKQGKIETISSSPITIVSKVEGGPDSTLVWWSLQTGGQNLSQQNTPKEWNRSAGLLQQFAYNLYRENMQSEVEYAEDVVVYSKEEAKRMALVSGKLQAKITKREKEKNALEAAWSAKTNELTDLNQKLQKSLARQELVLAAKERELNEMNKRLQKSLIRQEIAQQEVGIMLQAMEMAKEKISRMN
ncbi:hypothetical protein [Sabulibacter ruber]|uniref:hypothetical protein n=1 Tax=Sabulibacter ruber TaxID=2811901 RepID=UPI001A978ABC|nr:hypothetical protein [Sabulibacter ruber]